MEASEVVRALLLKGDLYSARAVIEVAMEEYKRINFTEGVELLQKIDFSLTEAIKLLNKVSASHGNN